MQILFSTGSLWSYSIDRCFALAASAGFDGLEIVVDQRWETRQPEYLLGMVNHYRLPIGAIHSPFWPSIPGWPGDQPGRIRQARKLAIDVGARVVVHHLPARTGHLLLAAGGRFIRLPVPFWDDERSYRHWLQNHYRRLQEEPGPSLCIENMPAYIRFGRRWNLYMWNSPGELRRFDHLTLDTTHIGTWGDDPIDYYKRLGSRVRHVHLSNYTSGREHQLPESGQLRLDRFVQMLANDGFGGAVVLEVVPEALAAGASDEVIVDNMRATMELIREWTANK